MDVEHVLQLNEQLNVEDEAIEGRADRALDRVLYRTKAASTSHWFAASSASAIVDNRKQARLWPGSGSTREPLR